MHIIFRCRALAVLACGLLIRTFVPPACTAGSPSTRIDQSSFVTIGGIEQWISIKGEDRNNPVLLVVHGGPGESQWPQADRYIPWEKAFTVVLWDQRGA